MYNYHSNSKKSSVGSKPAAQIGIDVEAFEALSNKFDQINDSIVTGNNIPKDLTKDFVTFPLSNDPYSGDW